MKNFTAIRPDFKPKNDLLLKNSASEDVATGTCKVIDDDANMKSFVPNHIIAPFAGFIIDSKSKGIPPP